MYFLWNPTFYGTKLFLIFIFGQCPRQETTSFRVRRNSVRICLVCCPPPRPERSSKPSGKPLAAPDKASKASDRLWEASDRPWKALNRPLETWDKP